jgi:hypothetical protein
MAFNPAVLTAYHGNCQRTNLFSNGDTCSTGVTVYILQNNSSLETCHFGIVHCIFQIIYSYVPLWANQVFLSILLLKK